MPLDLVLRQAHIAGDAGGPRAIGIKDGRIVEIAPAITADAPALQADGRLIMPGYVETQIHLDKSCISERCTCSQGTLREAIAQVAAAKTDFTEEDVYARARRTIEKAIVQGTTRMRTHVEIDPRIGFKGFHAVRRLKQDYAWAIDLQLCVFPQEGLLNDPGTDDLLVEACRNGADLIGGAPYVDSDPNGQIARIFDIAGQFDMDVDLHLDFDLDPSWMHLDEVCRQTEAHRWGGRVAIGHASKLSAVDDQRLMSIGRRLAEAGVALTVLPATDLYLMGREHTFNVPRGVAPAHKLLPLGVTCSLATNNVLNPFTPFGDASLIRMANLYANAAQAGTPAEIAACFAMVTTQAAKLMRLGDYGIAVGNPADIVVLDCADAASAVGELAQPVLGIKRGRMSFNHPAAVIHYP
jgi:cytosine deaminase